MKRLIFFVVVVSVFVLSLISFAQDVKKLSLEECIKIALENNSQLRNAARDIKYAGAEILTSRAALLPSLDAYFSSGRYIQGERKRKADVPIGVDSLSGSILYEQKDIIQAKVERNSHYASVQLSQNIWDWGRSWYYLSQTKLAKKNMEFTYLDKHNFVVYNVNEKYFALLKALKLREVYEEAVIRSEEQLKKIESMYEIGAKALSDVYKAKVALGNDRIFLINQKNEIINAYANLANSIGLDPSIEIEVEDIDVKMPPIVHSIDDAVAISLQKNADLKKFELNVKNYKYGKRMAQLAYLPTVGGMIRYSRDNEYFDRVYNKNLNEDYSISLGVQVNLNIFRGFADKAVYNKQCILFEKAIEDLNEKKRLLKAVVVYAFNILNANKEIADITQENLESANEDLRLAQERYKIGAGTLLEVIDAQLAVTQGKSALVSAKYDYQIALSYLNYVIGSKTQ